MLEVKLYPDADSIADGKPLTLEVEYVSLVNHSTYGPPSLVAPAPRSSASDAPRPPRAEVDDEVLYINTSVVPAFSIKRLDD